MGYDLIVNDEEITEISALMQKKVGWKALL